MSIAMSDRSEADGQQGTEVTCHRCGYTWIYSGERWTATCPNCNAKTATGLGRDDTGDG